MFLNFSNKNEVNIKVKSMSDEEIINAYKVDRDNHYPAELFQRYTYLIFGVCMKYLKHKENAKDAVMQIFENLLHDLIQLEIRNFKAWIYTVAKNHCLMQLRKQKTVQQKEVRYRRNTILDFMELNPINHLNGNDNPEEQLNKLHEAIQKLNKKQMKCIDLFFLQNNSYKQVTEITGYSMKQVKSHIQNGKRKLKLYLEEK